ncbi:MAG: tRNA uridine-5-carboxymethylaminomethyl(34) synthesis GTPase MnmE [Bacteroidales bacterium]
MTQLSETICALATAPGKGAISIIRVSGPETFAVVQKIFTPISNKNNWFDDGHTIHYGYIKDNTELIDDVLVAVFRSPKSYTGEDSVEINCHASVYIQNKILQLLIRNGARLANPGEYTMRAYINGKLDLSQAEAVADLLASSTEAAHKVAVSQIKGGYSLELKDLREKLLHFLAMLELELDFSEEDVEFADRDQLFNLVTDVRKRVEKLLESFTLGNAIKDGIPVCIVGEPNVGKSTLLNAILNEEKAIVSEVPGTTRDTIEDVISIQGVTFRLFDTAGIRNTSDKVEILGIDRTYEKISSASFVLLLVDVTSPIHIIKKNIEIIKKRISNDARIIIIVNKVDLVTQEQLEDRFTSSVYSQLADKDNVVYISAKKKQNIQSLIDTLVDDVQYSNISQHDAILTNSRHYEALQQSHVALQKVCEGIETGLTHDLISLELRQALHYIGSITGTITNEEMLGHIFENFCIGK